MLIKLDVDELRSIAPLAVSAAEKMEESNAVITSIVSSHDWKCPERASIDESLERIKSNSVVLNNAFVDFSNNIISIANGFTDYINEQKRFDVTYSEDVANLLLILGSSGTSTVSAGNNVGGIVSAMEMNSMHTSNIASLHSASREINIVDFSLFTE